MQSTVPEWKAQMRQRLVQVLDRSRRRTPYQLRGACVVWCGFDHEFNYHVTIQCNEPLIESRQLETARRFGALANYSCLGKRWQRWPVDERAFFVGVTENGATYNSHLHLLLRMPRRYAERFAAGTNQRTEQDRLSQWFTVKGRAKHICLNV